MFLGIETAGATGIQHADVPLSLPGDYVVTVFACLNDDAPCDGSVSGFRVHDLQLAIE